LNSTHFEGDESVLHVGCGNGLIVIGCAKRLKAGRSFGIHIWKSGDQAGNSREATLRNANLEGVIDRGGKAIREIISFMSYCRADVIKS
jgi:cyclopropane fatty-acyl-phospholipid synthase-like methyltransferase